MKKPWLAQPPDILFVIAAGNEAMDNSSNKYINMCIKGQNIIAVGALGKNFRKASY